MSGKGYVDGKVAVEGDFTFALAKAGKTLAWAAAAPVAAVAVAVCAPPGGALATAGNVLQKLLPWLRLQLQLP
jgi:hypothetical protein